MKERTPTEASSPRPELPASVIEHAENSRTNPKQWLGYMAEHLARREITKKNLAWFADMVEKHKTATLFARIERDFPKATEVFTHMSSFLAMKVLGDHTYGHTWPGRYSLAGIETSNTNALPCLDKTDLQEARIPYVTDRSGRAIPLETNAIEDTPVAWKLSMNVADVCSVPSGFFSTA